MALANVIELGIGELAACVKVDDTVPGIEEGLAAGMWTVGLSLSGNEAGLTLAELHALAPDELQAHRRRAAATLARAGSHVVIDSIAALPAVLEAIEARLARGERP
jgi:phosphonoacetaldehyde hydrolase